MRYKKDKVFEGLVDNYAEWLLDNHGNYIHADWEDFETEEIVPTMLEIQDRIGPILDIINKFELPDLELIKLDLKDNSLNYRELDFISTDIFLNNVKRKIKELKIIHKYRKGDLNIEDIISNLKFNGSNDSDVMRLFYHLKIFDYLLEEFHLSENQITSLFKDIGITNSNAQGTYVRIKNGDRNRITTKIESILSKYNIPHRER